MRSFISAICLLCLSSCHAGTLKKKYSFSGEYKITFDEQSISNSSLVFSACRVDQIHNKMSCSVVLQPFPDAKTINEMRCESNYKAGHGRRIEDKFRLKKLFKNYVAFVWSEGELLRSDVSRSHLTFSLINMDDCKVHDYPLETQIDDFHIVVYDQIFDVYYHNESMDKHFLTGMTFDSRAQILNGPAVSYLPSEYFTGDSHMCSVQTNSSDLGHYVITPDYFHLVKAEFNRRKQIGILPIDSRNAVYDCSKNSLGYCWLDNNNKRIVSCVQYNSAGGNIFSTGESLKYDAGTWMAMKNLGPSELLIVNNECADATSCTMNTEKVRFHVLKVNYNGKADDLYQFDGLECINATAINSEVVQKDDGRICATVACKTGVDESIQTVNLLSTCFLK